MSLTKPSANKPTLFGPAELRTFLHDMGHAIYLLSQDQRLIGSRGFIEIPSFLFEEWLSVPSLVRRISGHYSYLHPKYLTDWKLEHPNNREPPERLSSKLAYYEFVSRRDINLVPRLQTPLWGASYD